MSDRVTAPQWEGHAGKRPPSGEVQALADIITDRDILPTIEALFRKYVALPPAAILPLSLWCVGTYFSDCFDAYGYVVLTSPLPECGKTQTQEVMQIVCKNPWHQTSSSEAAIFTLLHCEDRPTLFFDEIEALGRAKKSDRYDAISSIVNVGYRKGARVLRVVMEGQKRRAEPFNVYGPKCFAAIGRLSPTIEGRSFVVEMQRCSPSERPERFQFGRVKAAYQPLRDRLKEAMTSRKAEVEAAYRALPDLEFLSDRNAEISLPLFALCQVFAFGRVLKLKQDLLSLFKGKSDSAIDDSTKVRLLSDCRTVWPMGAESVFSSDLRSRLRGIEDSPWPHDDKFNLRKLAWLLSGFGINSRSVRIGDDTAKGYIRSEFEVAWNRYLSPAPAEAPLSVTPSQPASIAANKDALCDVVTDKPPCGSTDGGTQTLDFDEGGL